MIHNHAQKVIGFWGLTFNSGNMGCNALSFGFLSILNKVVTDKTKIYVFFQGQDFDTESLNTEKIKVHSVGYNPRSWDSIRRVKHLSKECDISFDFTAGDSFSDIYGLKGFVKSCLFKKLAIKYSKRFVLGPQTYGPFQHGLARSMAKNILHKSNYACSRDKESAEYVKSLYHIDLDVYTDVAFALPYQNQHILNPNRRKIGINISGLLWNGGYTGTNQFGLTVDYQRYIEGLLERLLEYDHTDIYIIPHVISSGTNPECDYNISEILAKRYNKLILAPRFTSPIEAKSFISEMDVFTGARMHATIGAFSAGVVTIPFSYSRKFEGLYNNLGYPYTINARTLDTQTAITQTLEYIDHPDKLISSQGNARLTIGEKLSLFEEKIEQLLTE